MVTDDGRMFVYPINSDGTVNTDSFDEFDLSYGTLRVEPERAGPICHVVFPHPPNYSPIGFLAIGNGEGNGEQDEFTDVFENVTFSLDGGDFPPDRLHSEYCSWYSIEAPSYIIGDKTRRPSWLTAQSYREGDKDFLLFVSRSVYIQPNIYGPGEYKTRIRVLSESYRGFTHVDQDEWRSYTDLHSANVVRAHGRHFLVLFTASDIGINTGQVFAIESDGTVANECLSTNLDWAPDDSTWFRSGGRSFLLAVRNHPGENVAVYEILREGRLGAKVHFDQDDYRWSRVRRFEAGEHQFALFYRQSDSTMRIFKLDESTLCEGQPKSFQFDDYAHAHLVLASERIKEATQTRKGISPDLKNDLRDGLDERPLAGVAQGALLNTVNGSVGDCTIEVDGDTLLVQSSTANFPKGEDWIVRRLSTTLVENVSELFIQRRHRWLAED